MANNVDVFSIELFDAICKDISSSSIGLHHICKKHGISHVSFYNWIKDEDLLNKYMRARDEQADYLADEILNIADDKTGDLQDSEFGQVGNAANVNRARLQVEARKWIAAKLKPKKYGEKMQTEQSINVTNLPEWLTKPID